MRTSFMKLGVLGTSMLVFALSGFPVFSADKQVASGNVPSELARLNLKPLGRADGTKRLRLALCLPLRDSEGLTNFLAAIYDPASPEFHHYLTTAEFTRRFGPTGADYRAVMDFARTNGLSVVEKHPNRLVLDVIGNVADIERTFHTHLNWFRHPTENRNFIAPDVEPTVDAQLPIFQISGLDNFSSPHPNIHPAPARQNGGPNPLNGSSPRGSYIGNDFRNAYVPGTALTGTGQSVGLVEFDGFHPVDITNYANLIGLSNMPPLVVVPVDGGVNTPNQSGGEAEVALDIEMVVAMSPGVSNIYIYEAPYTADTYDARWVDMLSRMANDNLAKQLSSSWFDPGPGAGAAGEQLFQQMAAQGQSFFAASGDSDAFTGAIPFPDQSPSITMVGGTTLTTDISGNYVSETVWNAGGGEGSGGGICPGFPIPAWQLGVDMTTNRGSTVMRNIPDVALTADNVYVIYGNGTNGDFGGTSCAAPLWAGFTALVNQQAAQLGKPPLGFVNPAVYALCRGTNYATTFHDITAGDNTSPSSPTNFHAVPGFDLCTGWGTPSGTNLINALATPDNLSILPGTFFLASGPVGGPFTRTNWNFTLTNSGAASLNWSLGGAPSWLQVFGGGGTLAANGSTNIALQLIGEYTLPASNYVATILVTNQTRSRIQTIEVQLNVGRSIIQNGGFETGDFSGWTLAGTPNSGSTVYNTVTDATSLGDNFVHSGIYGAFLGDTQIATLSQTLNTLSGRRYVLSFWLLNPQSGSGQQFLANWNTNSLVTNRIYFLNNPPTIASWTNVTFVLTAANTNTTLQFGAENPPDGFGLDDVSVTPAPTVTFASFAANTNGVQLGWNSLAGLNYQVQYKSNLTQPSWLNLTNIAATSSVTSFADTNFPGGASQRYYRLILLP